MDCSTILKVGEMVSREYIVDKEDTADNIGNIGVTVLSTPAMIKYMEQTAATTVFERLPEKFRPVGTKININHINPTPVGEKITVNAIVTNIDGPKVTFQLEALNRKLKIGYGEYELHVIDLDKFRSKFYMDIL